MTHQEALERGKEALKYRRDKILADVNGRPADPVAKILMQGTGNDDTAFQILCRLQSAIENEGIEVLKLTKELLKAQNTIDELNEQWIKEHI